MRAVRLSLPMALAATLAAGQTPAEDYIAAGHWKQARALVEPRFRQQPNDPLANFLMSQIGFAFGDRETPFKLAEKAVALDGRVAKYHRQLAEALGVEAQHANVFQQLILAHRFRKEIDEALALDRRDVQALRDLMEFYLLAPGIAGGDRGKARAVAAQIGGIEPAEGLLALARLGDADALRRAVEAEPSNYRARMAMANYLLEPSHRDLEGAERQAREAVRTDRGRVDGYAALAEIYARRGQWAELDAVLAEAEKAVPDDLVPYCRAGDALIESGADRARAERYFRKYASQAPEGNEPSLAEAQRKIERARK